MILYGKNSVLERLRKDPASINRVFLQDNFNASDIEDLIKANTVPSERLPPEKLSRIKPAKDLQGIVARIDKFEYTPFSDLLNRGQNENSVLIFLDRVSDPQNLGSIMRILACFGGFSLVIPRFEACEVTDAVLHVASGGENYVPLSKAPNLSNAIITAKKRGYWIAGAVLSDDAEDIGKVEFPFPLGLVLGSEGKGIRHGIDTRLDVRVRVPMGGAKLSFNVNTAAAIFCYEISKQRNPQD